MKTRVPFALCVAFSAFFLLFLLAPAAGRAADPEVEIEIEGRVEAGTVTSSGFTLRTESGPVRVRFDADTDFQDEDDAPISPAIVLGAGNKVEVEGIMGTDGIFAATEIELEGKAGVTPEPREPTVFDPNAPPRTEIQVLPGLRFGARIEFEYQFEENFDLDEAVADDLTIAEPLVSLALSYDPIPLITLFANVEVSRAFQDDDEGDRNDESRALLKQLFLSLNEPVKGLNVKIGRSRFKDEREWVYDEELDGIRFFYTFSRYAIDLSATERNDQDMLHGSEFTDEPIRNYMAWARYYPEMEDETEIGAYVFYRDDRSFANESPLFLGVQVEGEYEDLKFWGNAAHVRGDSGRNKIRGFGFDVGGSYEFDWYPKPYVTLAYAFGGGDADPDDGEDKNFRQTGLQENDARFHGRVRFPHYGAVLEPELSNLHIYTAGLGAEPVRDFSVDLVYHYYRQDKASRNLSVGGRDTTELGEDPDGIDDELGQEIDFIAGHKSRHVQASLIAGWFFPGDAFSSSADDARFVELELRYEF